MLGSEIFLKSRIRNFLHYATTLHSENGITQRVQYFIKERLMNWKENPCAVTLLAHQANTWNRSECFVQRLGSAPVTPSCP